MDTDEDMRHRREELQRAEKQERLLRMRDRDNAIVAEVLRGIIMHKVYLMNKIRFGRLKNCYSRARL